MFPQCSCQNGINFLRCLALQEKKTWWQLASRCCWNRARRLTCFLSASVIRRDLQFGTWTDTTDSVLRHGEVRRAKDLSAPPRSNDISGPNLVNSALDRTKRKFEQSGFEKSRLYCNMSTLPVGPGAAVVALKTLRAPTAGKPRDASWRKGHRVARLACWGLKQQNTQLDPQDVWWICVMTPCILACASQCYGGISFLGRWQIGTAGFSLTMETTCRDTPCHNT